MVQMWLVVNIIQLFIKPATVTSQSPAVNSVFNTSCMLVTLLVSKCLLFDRWSVLVQRMLS